MTSNASCSGFRQQIHEFNHHEKMKICLAHQLLTWLVFALICGIAFMPCFAGAPGPPFSESRALETVEALKAAKDDVLQGDNVPRRVRLAGALYSLANFYNNHKSYEKSDRFYSELIALISEDKSDRRLDNLRYYSDAMASDYLQRGDLVKAKLHIDIALKICREDAKQKEVLPSVLTTLAHWQRRMNQSREAESTLLEAIGLLGDFGFGQRRELAQIYLETDQLAKADKTIAEMEKSTYADSSSMFLRAKWLQATGKTSEANDLEASARAKEVKEREHRENSQ
jgi:tetratricopeptide (TPR) repeat protein